jgi:hypothetical protein
MTIKSGDVSRDSTRAFCQGFFKNKKAQVTIFIIIGIVILFAFAGIMYFTKTFTKQDILAAEEPILAEVPQEFKPLQTFTDSCLNQIGKRGLLILGEQGGYIYPDLVGEYSATNPTEADGIDLEPLKVPYWHYNVNPNDENTVAFKSLKPQLYAVDDNELSIESQLASYVRENLNECLANYEPFSDLGFEVENLDKDTKEVIVSVGEESVNFWLKMRVKGTKGESEHQIDQFYVKIPLRLKHFYEVATDVTNAESNFTYLETMALELVHIYALPDSSKLPPIELVTFDAFSINSWTQENVNLKIKSLLTSHVPMIRYLSSNNFYRYEYPVSDLSGLYQKTYDNMIIPLENSENVDISFDYFGWDIFVDVNEGDQKIEPAEIMVKSPLGIIPFEFNFQKYYNTYDISFPVLVTVRDPDAFGGEGYQFSFALEAAIVNNEAADADYVEPEISAAFKDSMVCDENKRDTGLLKTVVVDSFSKEPLELVKIGFSIPDQDSCDIGLTDDLGELETNYPVAYGGVVNFMKTEYLDSYYPIDTYNLKNQNAIIGYTVAGYPQEVIEIHKFKEIEVTAKKKSLSKCIKVSGGDKHCFFNGGDPLFPTEPIGPVMEFLANGSESRVNELYFFDSAKEIAEGEMLMYNLERVADSNPLVINEDVVTSFSVEGDQKTTVRLVPGIYAVTATLISQNSVSIPKDERCDGKCVDISAVNLSQYIGGITEFNSPITYLEITPDQLYSSQEIEFYVLDYDLSSLPKKGNDNGKGEFNVIILEDQTAGTSLESVVEIPAVRAALEPQYK